MSSEQEEEENDRLDVEGNEGEKCDKILTPKVNLSESDMSIFKDYNKPLSVIPTVCRSSSTTIASIDDTIKVCMVDEHDTAKETGQGNLCNRGEKRMFR